MRTLAIIAVIILGSGGASCCAQAVAEGAMVHANSAAATTKVGSALGNALNKAMAGNAEKSESVTAGKLEHLPHTSRKTLGSGNGEKSSDPLVITSIRGGYKPCTAAQPPIQATGDSSDKSNPKADASAHTQAVPATPLAAQGCAAITGAPSSYKSVVNLSSHK